MFHGHRYNTASFVFSVSMCAVSYVRTETTYHSSGATPPVFPCPPRCISNVQPVRSRQPPRPLSGGSRCWRRGEIDPPTISRPRLCSRISEPAGSVGPRTRRPSATWTRSTRSGCDSIQDNPCMFFWSLAIVLHDVGPCVLKFSLSPPRSTPIFEPFLLFVVPRTTTTWAALTKPFSSHQARPALPP